ncbi:MAG: hypothetical protein PHO74_06065 [Weeksellaceae bacterium]|nr:hypothetical protein [Weeksellaceae bacterium]
MKCFISLLIGLFFIISNNLSAQSECRKVPMQEVKIIRVQKVKQNGKIVRPKDNILLYKEIPSKPGQQFFKCNGLTFEKGGELIFRAKGSDSQLLTYNDFIQKSGPGKSNSSNLLSRGQTTNCQAADTPYNVLLDDFVVLKNDECLYAFFDWDTFWLKSDQVIKFTDSSILPKTLIFKDSKGKSYSFDINNSELIIKSKELPEEETFDVLLDFDSVETTIAEGIRVINLQKTIERLKSEQHSQEEIFNILMQNYFSEAYENDVRKDLLIDSLHNAISNPVFQP